MSSWTRAKTPRLMLAAVPIVVLAAGTFMPAVGLVVPLILLAAVAGSFRGRRRFCSTACPRAALLELAASRISRRRPLPETLRAPATRTLLCAFLVLCSVGQVARLWPDYSALGLFFWAVCAVTAIVSLAMGFFWKPRAWCAVCPVGALQDSIAARVTTRSAERME